MLSEDAPYESWAADQGLDGVTDFHIADSPFYYTGGWDFVAVSSIPALMFSLFVSPIHDFCSFSCLSSGTPKGIGLREICFSLFRIPATQHMY